MNYKKFVSTQEVRFRILRMLSFIPDRIMLSLQYRLKLGRWPDLKHPERFTEKLQLYKMKYRNPLMGVCVDKYAVRKYVEVCGLGAILNELYGVYDSPEDLDFEVLPNRFVLKTTDGGGGNNVLLVKDKNGLDEHQTRKTLDSWKNVKDVNPGREWAYTKMIRSRIIAERYLEDPDSKDGSVDDYKFLCYGGKFRYLWLDRDRYSNHRRGFWDENLHFLGNVESDHPTFSIPPMLPENVEEMIGIAEKLSRPFPFARIDLYNIAKRILFGEITFYPWSGYVQFVPDSFDYDLGKYLDLKALNINMNLNILQEMGGGNCAIIHIVNFPLYYEEAC